MTDYLSCVWRNVDIVSFMTVKIMQCIKKQLCLS